MFTQINFRDMKKIKVLIFLATLTVATACRKERTCECEVTTTVSTASGTTIKKYTKKVTKDKQKAKQFRISEECYNLNTTTTGTNNVTTTVENACELN